MDKTEALDTLRKGIADLANSDRFKAFLECRAKFHQYSRNNAMMIAFQNPEASIVAGFNRWKELGRFVKKGEKGIAIFAPMMYAKKDEATGEKTGDILRGFRVVHVFDVAQTDGKELPEPCAPKILTGDEGSEVYGALVDFVTHAGIVVRKAEPSTKGANGEYSPLEKRITVRADLPQLQTAKTMCHETAHFVLHSDAKGATLPREVKETEAEATAFLVLARLGLRSDDYSFPYLAGWAGGDVKVLEASLERIEKATEEILHAVNSRLESLVTA